MLQIKNIYWTYDEKNRKYSQKLKLFDNTSSTTKEIDLKDYSFKYKLSEERFCPGIGDEACVQNKKSEQGIETEITPIINTSYELCPVCEKKLGFRSAFFFREEPNEKMREYLSQTHYIYLAYFAPEIVKVGTASHQRRFIRPIEQDASAYVFIANNDGFGIQDLESAISKKLKITESVNSKTKFKNIGMKANTKKAEQTLLSNFDRVLNMFGNDEKFSDWLLKKEDLEPIDLSTHKYFPEKKVNKVDHEEYTHMSGNFLGLRGKYILFQNNSNIMAMNIRYVIGRMIEDYESEFSYFVEDDGQIEMF